jgi:serine/threonine protein phosphatase PrpC
MWARIKGMVQAVKPNDPDTAAEEILPAFDAAPPDSGTSNAVPTAEPVAAPASDDADIPVALPVPSDEQPAGEAPVAPPLDITPVATPEPAAPVTEPEPAPVTLTCPVCGSSHLGKHDSCADCGYYFSPADLAAGAAGAASAAAPAAPATPAAPSVRLQDRFEVHDKISERLGVVRFRGLDWGSPGGTPVPVVILKQARAEVVEEAPVVVEPIEDMALEDSPEEVLPSFDMPQGLPATETMPAAPRWPSIQWEAGLLQGLNLPSLPQIVAQFTEGDSEYLVEEVPTGQSLWDGWDDPEVASEVRFGWLVQVAETLHRLHECNVIFEALRPDFIVITPEGEARFTDLSDLLPIPLPSDAPVRGTLYTPPEVLAGQADARSDLYSFGAMLYALHVGRELSDGDFDRPGHPKPFIPRFPDIHPAFGRLVTKTFRREVDARFPSDEASREDSTGFRELMRTLQVLGRTMDRVRLEIASWTTTGIVRTGNEDAFALLHSTESRQDDMAETALVLLCDGMGGYEAGEVAAALAIQALRQRLVQQPPMKPLAGASAFPDDALSSSPHPNGHLGAPLDVDACKQFIKDALRDANKQVFSASRAPGSKRRGMGCTAEVVFTDGRNLVVGHVGDSRTYHLHEGRLIQLTRDQTLVNRLVELGTLSPEEAETHPRRNELQQAVGGQPDVEPGIYASVLKPGDWVVVCSDGVTNHISAIDLKAMLQSEAQSAEMAARRLVNFTNIQGATDNATVVVIRVT